MARPDPKPFDPNNVKSESDYAKEALQDAKNTADSGKGQINREEDTGDTAGAARHKVTDNVPPKKGS
jgi:hypothetical protein